MVTACILIIGNEILSGRTTDANLSFLSRELNELGVQVTEARVIPDVAATIVNTLNEVRVNFDYVITTGGIGPTHDDITAECIAEAFGVDLVVNLEIEAMMHSRPAPDDVMRSRLRMARIPEGATLVRNEIGPPGFQLENVFVLAGVPGAMQAMVKDFPGKIVGGKPVRSMTLGAFLAESPIAEGLAEIQAANPEVELGSYPIFRPDQSGINLVMSSTDPDAMQAVAEEVRQLIAKHGQQAVENGIE